MNVIPLWAQLVALILILLLSAFFSLAETSMMALNRYRLKALVKQGRRGAVLAAKLLSRTDRLLGMILIGNNVLNAAASALVTAIAIARFGNNRTVLFIATSSVAFLIIVLSEITPKVIGATYPATIALTLSYILTPLARLFFPVVWFVNLFVSVILKLMRVPRKGEEGQRLSQEELRAVVLESGSFIPTKHTSMLVNLLDVGNVAITDVMTPRALIEAVDLDDPIETVTERLITSYHNKIPVYQGEINRVVGILHVRKCLALMSEGPLTKEGILESLAEAYFVPGNTPVIQQLQYFQEKKRRLGLVVDEYGELQGLVTLEDIVEEIIGEFTTSLPRADHGAVRWVNNEAIVEGAMPLRELNRRLGLNLPTDGPKTLNGLIVETLQAIPDADVAIRFGDCAVETLQVQNQVVRTAKLLRLT